MAGVKPIPEGYRCITPYLIVADAAAAIVFYREAFGASERMRLVAPDGKIGHAELVIGDSLIMLADEHPDRGVRAPQAFGGSPVSLHFYVEDVDGMAARATTAGAKQVRAVSDQFYGDRSGTFADPFGHVWHIASHIEDVSPEEVGRRAVAAMNKQG